MMPREKLQKYGCEMLDSRELLAIIFNTGYKGENVLELSGRLVQCYGENAVFTMRDPHKISDEMMLPLHKACQLVAVAELGKRIYGRALGVLPELRNAREVYKYLSLLRKVKKEQFVGLYLNARNRLIYEEVLSVGSLDTAIVHPREVFAPAIECRASQIIVVHNHPSMDPNPSANDIQVTKRLISAGKLMGVKVIDHIIIAGKSYTSIAERTKVFSQRHSHLEDCLIPDK